MLPTDLIVYIGYFLDYHDLRLLSKEINIEIDKSERINYWKENI